MNDPRFIRIAPENLPSVTASNSTSCGLPAGLRLDNVKKTHTGRRRGEPAYGPSMEYVELLESRIDSLITKLHALEVELRAKTGDLEAKVNLIYHAPGMPGMLEAEEDFYTRNMK